MKFFRTNKQVVDAAKKIQRGMTSDEVLAIMGPAASTDYSNGELRTLWWTAKWFNMSFVLVSFEAGRVNWFHITEWSS